MPTVWIRVDPRRCTRFHRGPDCRQLRKGPSRGTAHELVEVDLNEVEVRPCRTCYPDAPAIEIRKVYCQICESPYACEHNGGVRVTTRQGIQRYVWPNTNQMPHYRTGV